MGSFKELSIEWMEEIEKYNTLALELASPENPMPLWLELLPLFKKERPKVQEPTSDL